MADISSSLIEEGASNVNGLADPIWNDMNGGPSLHRFRGVSVDRHRDYTTPRFYEDTYYRRDPYDSSGSGRSMVHGRSMSLGRTRGRSSQYLRSTSYHTMAKELDHWPREAETEERTIYKLERQWSHPNLRPRPRGPGHEPRSRGAGRKLPLTPSQPPQVVIPSPPPARREGRPNEQLLEWIENERLRRTPVPGGERAAATAPARRTPRHGTGRLLPKPPKSGLPPLVLNSAGPVKTTSRSRERKLPKPSSLDLRHSDNLFHQPSRSTSINFPRIDLSPSRISNFLDGTTIPLPSLPPSRAGVPRRHMDY